MIIDPTDAPGGHIAKPQISKKFNGCDGCAFIAAKDGECVCRRCRKDERADGHDVIFEEKP